jgi:hypothetical protein
MSKLLKRDVGHEAWGYAMFPIREQDVSKKSCNHISSLGGHSLSEPDTALASGPVGQNIVPT